MQLAQKNIILLSLILACCAIFIMPTAEAVPQDRQQSLPSGEIDWTTKIDVGVSCNKCQVLGVRMESGWFNRRTEKWVNYELYEEPMNFRGLNRTTH
ncbi:hypothetical protein KM043_012859 [Ampulex compressa]|nr:hypothetical protein KM043_012859 [Ampulex compressa]